MKLLAALFALAPSAETAAPPAAAPHVIARPAKPSFAARADPLDVVADAFERARARGCDRRQAAAHALEALAYSDLSALTLNGPHTRAGERVSRRAEKGGRRLILAVAQRGFGA